MAENGIVDMLTARDVQEMLKVDRSTVYRMADAGHLPAIKVGKQWRFPKKQFHHWFQAQVTPTAVPINQHLPTKIHPSSRKFEEMLPWEWLQIIQSTFAELLGVMVVVTDIQGRPINQVTNPCGFYTAVNQQPGAMSKFIESWRGLVTAVDLTPTFRLGHLGLLCARSMIAVGTELKGMVIAGCIAPTEWPPSPTTVAEIAQRFNADPEFIQNHAKNVYVLDDSSKLRVLNTLPQIAALIAHIVDDRNQLIERLDAIASLAQLHSL